MATINLFGASGHAKVIMDIIEAQGDAVGVLYDDAPRVDCIHGHRVVCASLEQPVGALIISIGSNAARCAVANRLNAEFATAIHPRAIVSPSATVGCGSVVMQGAIIQADTAIGRHCIINSGASVDHECRIADFVHISPHATLCGNVSVGLGSWVGAGATVIPGITIGRNCIIGAGATVIRNIPDGAVAVGSPAKIIKYNSMNFSNLHVRGGGNLHTFARLCCLKPIDYAA